MKRITFLMGIGLMVLGLYLTVGPWTLMVTGLLLTLESRGLPE